MEKSWTWQRPRPMALSLPTQQNKPLITLRQAVRAAVQSGAVSLPRSAIWGTINRKIWWWPTPPQKSRAVATVTPPARSPAAACPGRWRWPLAVGRPSGRAGATWRGAPRRSRRRLADPGRRAGLRCGGWNPTETGAGGGGRAAETPPKRQGSRKTSHLAGGGSDVQTD